MVQVSAPSYRYVMRRQHLTSHQTVPFYTGWKQVFQTFQESIGIFNPLHLCYRNAVFQLLLHTPLLLNFLEFTRLSGHVCVPPDLCTFCNLKAFANAYWTGSRDRSQFTAALDALWEKLLTSFWASMVDDLEEQQDAREFLERTLAQFHNEASNIDVSQYFRIATNKHFHCWECRHIGKADVPDQQYFLVADIQANRQVPHCEEGHMVLVDAPADPQAAAKRCVVDEAITPGSDTTAVDRKCAKCNVNTKQTIIDKIVQLPELLLVQVNRFSPIDQTKAHTPVAIEDRLQVSECLLDESTEDQGRAYELYGVLFHHGDQAVEGHYTAAVRTPSGRWALLDDDRPVVFCDSLEDLKDAKAIKNDNDVFAKEAYILAYQRLPLPTESEAASNPALAGSHRTWASKSVSHLPPPPDEPSTDSDGDTIVLDAPSSDDGGGGGSDTISLDYETLPAAGGVHLRETIAFDGRDVDWVVQQQLLLPPEAGALINLPPRAKVQRAKVKITLTSLDNGEILEGEAAVSLRPQRNEETPRVGVAVKRTPLKQRLRSGNKPKPAAKPARTMNTKAKPAAKPKSVPKASKAAAAAKPRGIAKATRPRNAKPAGRARKASAPEPESSASAPASASASASASQSPCPEADHWVRRSKRWHKHHPSYAESSHEGAD
ncbi:hypothetical protein BDV59DRAFT_4087 [Aspergillus ambiguus]|uniref:uncharacterized protein n=1 Tax=Aspergillus ambiguus TaxID=176160 RepID=UPI003CCCDD52